MAEDAFRMVLSDDPVAAAVDVLASALTAADGAHGSARLAIPGGSVPAALPPLRAALGDVWKRARLTWVDERCVPFEHDDSNRGSAYRSGALSAESPPSYELPLYLDGEAPDDAVARAGVAFAERFGSRLDVALLGMGEDGHVASLFHGVAIEGTDAAGMVGWVSRSPKPPPVRVTLTRVAIETAPVKVLLVTGPSKRDALRRLMSGDVTVSARGLGGLVVVTDQRVDPAAT